MLLLLLQLLLLLNHAVENLADVVIVYVSLRMLGARFVELRHRLGRRIHQTAPVHLLHVWQRNFPATAVHISPGTSTPAPIRHHAASILQNTTGSGRQCHNLLLLARRHLQVVLVDVQLVVVVQLAGRAGTVAGRGRYHRCRSGRGEYDIRLLFGCPIRRTIVHVAIGLGDLQIV